MTAIAGDFDLVFRIFAALTAVFFTVPNRAAARRMGALFHFVSSHVVAP
jgi:hypothetical protein